MSSTSKNETEAATVAAIARENQAPIKETGFAIPFLIWPQTQQITSLEKFQGQAYRKRANVTVHDYQSFIAYVKSHCEFGTALFAELTEVGGKFVAHIDYHPPVTPAGSASGTVFKGAFDQHQCTLVMQHTPEWRRWVGNNRKGLSQVDFALFLEDNRLDVIEPDGGRLLEIVRTMEAKKKVNWKSAIRLDNGDRDLQFTDETSATAGHNGDLQVPTEFKLRIPVFVNGPEYPVVVRFRYSIDGGVLTVSYELERPHKVIELALLEARNAIQSELKLTVLNGNASVPTVT